MPLKDETPEDGPLFRPQAVAAATSHLGRAVEPVGVASWVLTLFLVALAVAICAFLALGKYARKETVVGVLEPSAGALRITAPKGGIITAVFVKEGDLVEAGAPLVSISFNTVLKSGAVLGDLLQAATDVQSSALADEGKADASSIIEQLDELRAKRSGLVSDLRQLSNQVDLERQQISLQQSSLESYAALHDRRFASDLDYQKAQIALIQAKGALLASEKEASDVSAEIAQVDAQSGRLKADGAETQAKIRSAIGQINEKNATLASEKQIILTAQKSGRVAAVQAKVGAPIDNAAALAIVLPVGAQLQAELWTPSRAAGFVQRGDKVRLLFDAFPYQRFGAGHGVVTEVANSPTPPNELPVPIETKEAMYRVIATLDRQDVDAYGRAWRLAPGMRLTADVVLDRRPFWEWLIDPLLASRRRAS